MRVNSLPTLAFLVLGYFSLEAAADDSYGESCTIVGLSAPTSSADYYSIAANCAQDDGVDAPTVEINIDSCFVNSFGSLQAQLNGNFGGSCSDVTLSGTVLSATCANGSGGTTSTSIDTNDYIGNDNGNLVCFDQNGL